ncbi:hypothetical protein FO519_002856 [Halicephalobus sp. NKZ332]|nr:hypothetical protein FO519_002856 [Halicephalobus sp. NKZ332]
MRILFFLLGAIGLVICDDGIDPEAGMRTPDIIKHWGYPVEEHYVTTDDGYILTVHRIPYGKLSNIPNDARRPVVFLQHGLEASSSSWITNLPQMSFGYLLADMGYDVWMGNIRGNLYSKNHTTLDIHSHDFWRFTWDDMVQHDLPAMIDAALTATNHTSLYYVGHSQGTLIMFSKLSSDPNFSKKIRKFFALAPVCTVQYIEGLLEFLAHDFYDVVEILYKILGEDEFLPDDKFMQTLEKLFCDNKEGEQLCTSFLGLIGGSDESQMNSSRIPVFLSDEPAGTSTMNILHWVQMVKSGKLQKYDYEDANQNMQHYGQTTPPEYDIGKLVGDVHLFWSPKDWLADQKDVEGFLLKNINKNSLKENHMLDEFNHMDFIWGTRAKDEVYKPIVMEIQKDVADNGDP